MITDLMRSMSEEEVGAAVARARDIGAFKTPSFAERLWTMSEGWTGAGLTVPQLSL